VARFTRCFPVPGINFPSIDQALVLDGIFATQLAEALKLGLISYGAKAKELLIGEGI